MTDRIKGFTITLDKDYRDDDAEAIITALQMVKCVAHVEPQIVTSEDHSARMRVKSELRDKFFTFIKENL